ncbi:uncharacterized protein B0I36DRAFT_41387 [Microdochium trichocladiopsis]|uniref:Uncharacterized protein n=1 Tax=Microdochium trichocladiopsis TaxID=1682393 RepID=A0A9P9BJI9_9PEZI|nr:uncharacterized protein B0I36DRAFT_41387 [Microdochium trichocladiopsis]KAH7016014.1 hypothetical protein B0I36DRAFT_41387 [Microdochium trichocladiopsis]
MMPMGTPQGQPNDNGRSSQTGQPYLLEAAQTLPCPGSSGFLFPTNRRKGGGGAVMRPVYKRQVIPSKHHTLTIVLFHYAFFASLHSSISMAFDRPALSRKRHWQASGTDHLPRHRQKRVFPRREVIDISSDEGELGRVPQCQTPAPSHIPTPSHVPTPSHTPTSSYEVIDISSDEGELGRVPQRQTPAPSHTPTPPYGTGIQRHQPDVNPADVFASGRGGATRWRLERRQRRSPPPARDDDRQ